METEPRLVLIVDDDQDVRRLLKLFLCRDCILAEASDGLQALEKISYSRFDYVISDIDMGKYNMDGYEFVNEILGRYPHQTSGGQMQRLLVARALIMGPDLLVADEATSMVDASTRVEILNELMRLKKEGMSVLFITHDVAQAYYISDRAAVMKDGEIVEMGPAEQVFFESEHPYTKKLISNMPKLH